MTMFTARTHVLRKLLSRNVEKVVCLNYTTSNSNDKCKKPQSQKINDSPKPPQSNTLKYLGIGAGLAAVIFYAYYETRKRHILLEHPSKNDKIILRSSSDEESIEETVGNYRSDLPTYTIDDVSQHSEMGTRVWVTYKRGVYDITDFISQHPGGIQIMMAAGSSLEPFWLMYGLHKTAQIFSMLEEMRIGNVSEEASQIALESMTDPYSDDPKRHKVLTVHSQKPFNAEPPASLLVENFHTPNDFFYVRNHLPVPDVDPETYELEVEVQGSPARKVLSLRDIMKLPKHTITSTIMCAGNRRSEFHRVKEVKGLNWQTSAIGNAKWTGARLVDVLKMVGIDDETCGYCHVHFEGLDADSANNLYTASIPICKATDKRGDVLLAYEMNGKPIPRDHGFPIRAVVPGTVGARNVKWLGRIFVSNEECDSHWQQKDYKGVSPSADPSKIDLNKVPAIQELPITSVICKPANGETVELVDGCIVVKGYAWSGGGRKIIRVDVTTDEGKYWHEADIDQQGDEQPPHHWSWTLWSAKIPVPKDQKHVEVWVKAVDSSYNNQPDLVQNVWNYRGFLNNAYHRIQVNVKG